MNFSTLLFCLAGIAQLTVAGYVLQDDYSPSNFFSMFTFFTEADPTHGFVQYVDEATAQSSGLISQNSSSVYMGVDHQNVAPSGRSSVRVTSNKVYNHGLIILDVAHMPEGCGTWPAFWMTGPDWPNNGEIDIIEGVNDQAANSMTLHTGPGCSITNNNLFSGTIATSDCDVNDPSQPTNAGCSIGTSQSDTYGSGFNAAGGGVYATDWTAEGISIYFFPRSSIPSDITSGNPNPSSWGTPLAMFQGGCNIDSSIKNQQIVFDTTFCGDWAGGVWGTSSCSAKAATCDAFVQDNPSAFADAYWEVNSLKVYQSNGKESSPNPPPIKTTKRVGHGHKAPHTHTHVSPAETPATESYSVWTTLPHGSAAPAPTAQAESTQVAPAPTTSTVYLNWSDFPQNTAAPVAPTTITVTQNYYTTYQAKDPEAVAQVTPVVQAATVSGPSPSETLLVTYVDGTATQTWYDVGVPTAAPAVRKRMHARHLVGLGHRHHVHGKRRW